MYIYIYILYIYIYKIAQKFAVRVVFLVDINTF